MSSYNIVTPARWIFAQDARTQICCIGDSQMSDTANYFGSLGLIKLCPVQVAGVVGSSLNSTAQVPARSLLSGTNITSTNIGSDATTSSLGVTNGEGWMLDPCTRLTFSADLAANAGLGNGVILNGMNYNGTTTISGYDWPLTQPSERAWFAGRNIRARVSYFDSGTAETMPFRFLTRRVGIGASATNVSTGYVNVAPAGVNGFASSGWTDELADPGTLSPSNNNDHEVRCVLECNGGNESTAGAFIIPHRVIYQAMQSTGVPANGVTWDLSGRAGISASDCLTIRGSQAAWANRFAQTVVAPKLVIISMLGHNVEVADRTSSIPNSTWIASVEQWNNRLLAAARQAVGDSNAHLISVMPWMYTVSANGLDSLAAADAADALLEAAAIRNAWGFVSLHRMLGRAAPARNDLHLTQGSPVTPQNSVHVASLFWRAMQVANDTYTPAPKLMVRRR
jgi:hypothetical protein